MLDFWYYSTITKEKFEDIVNEGVQAIPNKFLEKLSNVDIYIEEEPNSYQLEKLKPRKKSLLFGLYEGVPQIKRRHYGQVLPDKITIFKKPIEKIPYQIWSILTYISRCPFCGFCRKKDNIQGLFEFSTGLFSLSRQQERGAKLLWL